MRNFASKRETKSNYYPMNAFKKITAVCAAMIGLTLSANAAVLVIEGEYQNKNLYIQNSLASGSVGYCAFEVRVNDQLTHDEVNSTAFEIDLSSLNLKAGEQVTVKISHKEGCTPKVLNPEALRPRPTFTTEFIEVTSAGVLTWKTKNENGSLPFIVEQFRWNKWIYVGEVKGVGTPGEHTYSFEITAHSGENKFRVKQVGFVRETRVSPEARYTATVPQVTYTESSDKKNTYLFSAPTMYEVYDLYGNIILKGYGKEANLNPYNKGTYYLCYDNTLQNVTKK